MVSKLQPSCQLFWYGQAAPGGGDGGGDRVGGDGGGATMVVGALFKRIWGL